MRNLIVCEDIRKEVGGRNTLDGVYAGDILVGEFPAPLRIAIYAEYIIERPAAHQLRLRAVFLGGASQEIFDVGVSVPETAEHGVAFALPPNAVVLSERGTIVVEVSYTGQEWIEVANKRVELIPSPAGEAS